jgi:type I restriction enzyme S subunit
MNSLIAQITVKELIDRGDADIQTGPFGTQLKASEYVESGIPVINVRNIGIGNIRDADLEFITELKAEKLKNHRLQKGDIVFGRKGAVERHALISDDQDGWIQGSDCLRLRLSSDIICERYVSYYLRTKAHQDWMQALCSFGATMASLNQDIVKRITIPFPELATQRKIAAILTAYDDLIETNKRRIALLEKMAEEIYREWFVRLRFPGYQNTQFIKGIPEGWEVKKIRDIVNFQSGYSFKSETYCPDGRFGVVTIKNVHNGYFIDECSDRIEEIPSNMKQHCRLQNGEILLSLTGNVGRVCRVYGHDLLLNQRVAKLEPLYKNSQCYVYCFFRQSSVLKFCEMIATGAAQQNLSPIKLGDQKVLIPSCKLIQNFESQVSPLFEKSTLLLQTNKNLTKTRDLLLPRLISGKLPVEHLDIQTPPSMNP